MPAPSDPGFLVLHALRLKGFAGVDEVAAATGLDVDVARRELERAVDDGQATFRDGRITGFALSPSGRAGHAVAVAHELASSDRRGGLVAAYERFLGLNGELLAVCTDWQLRDGQTNDHRDEAYDAAVVARLVAVDEAVQPVCADLAALADRFARYGPRLAAARSKVEAGDVEWFAKPGIDSFHTVWFELHEDLLVTLGIERSKEGSTE